MPDLVHATGIRVSDDVQGASIEQADSFNGALRDFLGGLDAPG